MSTQRDYYEVLGVGRSATRQEIQSAYRRLAREHHPDVNREDHAAEERFKEINEAYRVLSDESQRQQYDQFGAVGDVAPGYGDPFAGVQDIFDMFFVGTGQRGGRRRTGGRAGGDIHLELNITLGDSLTGVAREFSFQRLMTCEACSGSGAKPGTRPQACSLCQGTGQTRTQRQTVFGTTVVSSTCPSCRGEGTVIADACATCSGAGCVSKTVKQKVDIPAGVEDGATMQVPSGGHDGERGGPPGDLYISIDIDPHKSFSRRGTVLATELKLSFVQLSLGDTVKIETLDGTAELDIPPGTQHGAELIIRGKGMPSLGRKDRGDLQVFVKLTVPKKLTERQKEILAEFEEAGGKPAPSRKKPKSYLDKFKETLRGEAKE